MILCFKRFDKRDCMFFCFLEAIIIESYNAFVNIYPVTKFDQFKFIRTEQSC